MKEGVPHKEPIPPIEIGRATGNDARGLREVQRDTWLNTYVNERSGIIRDDIEWYFNSFKKSFSEDTLKKTALQLQEQKPGEAAFVAKENGKVIGYEWAMKYPTYNELGALYVLPTYHGRSIGSGLWNQARSFFDPTLPTRVTVNKDNINAISFYEHLGFRPTEKELPSELTFPSGATLLEMEMMRPPEIDPSRSDGRK